MTETEFDFSTLSKISVERVSVEEDKLVTTDYHNPPYTLPKPTPTDKKSVRRRTSRTKTKKTQILEEKAGVEIDEILAEIEKDPQISSWKRQELSPNEFVEYAKRLLQYREKGELEFFICDLETQQLKWYHEGASLMGFAFCDPIERTGYFVGYKHPELEISEKDQEMILEWVVKLFEEIPYVNHNTKFDLSWMQSHTTMNIRTVEVHSDTMFQCSLYIGRDQLEAGEKFRLKDMSRRVLGFDFEWEKYLDDAMKSIRLKINRTFWNIKYKLVSIYAQFDGITTLLLYEAMKPKIEEAGMQRVHNLLTDSVTTFVEVETEGVYVDTELRKTLLEDYKGKMENISKAFSSFPIIQEWEKNNDEDFLITSTEKLAEVFFTPKYLALEPIETTAKGAPSTNKAVLEEIAAAKDPSFRTERKMAQLILDYRSVHKLESTYLSNLEKDLNGHIFYPDYNLLGARTGRISSYFHTIPKGNDIKRMFVSRFQENGGLILSGDYCISGNTEIPILAGGYKKVKDMERGEEFYTFSCKENGKIEPVKARSLGVTRKERNWVKVTLDNGETLETTQDHRFMLRDGSFKEAKDLKPKDSLMPYYTDKNEEGYNQVLDNKTGKWKTFHSLTANRYSYEEKLKAAKRIKKKQDRHLVIHHQDFDKYNNRPDNLEWLGEHEHWRLHSEITEEKWKDPEYREFMSANNSKTMQEYWDNVPKEEYDRRVKQHTEYWNRPENKKKQRESAKQQWADYTPEERKAVGAKISKSRRESEKGRGKNNHMYGRSEDIQLGIVRNFAEKLEKEDIEINQENWDKHRKEFFPNMMTFKTALPRLKKLGYTVNHKVSKVEFCGDKEQEFYDIEVLDGYPTFATKAGVFIHNSQLEVRVIAGISDDDNLREAYQKGYDVHRFTASKVFNKPMEKVSSGERGYAKTVVFGILYGKTIHSLAQDLGISHEDAQELQDFFFKGFPKVKEWVDRQHQFVRDHGYVETAWGRRRYIPWINDSREWMVEDAFRKAQNSPIQGAACLHGDTKISLLRGEEVPIKDLVDEEEFWVYSCTPEGEIVPGRAHSARKTKKVQQVAQVTLDNDEVIETTIDHRFMLRDGTYKEAQDLVEGESLMPLYRQENKDGYEEFKDNKSGKWIQTHRRVAKEEYSFQDWLKDQGIKNHKVISVKIVDKEIDVYDITVDKYHNFALTSGVFVHNSDITLFATNLMQNQTHEKNLRSMIIGTVHDSIESDTHPTELFDMVDVMRYCSETYPNKNFDFMNGVPLKFDYEIGTSWGGAVDIEEFKTRNHWRIAGFEKDIEALRIQLEKNYEVSLSDFEDSKADSDVIFRTIDPGKRISCDIIIK